MFSFPYFRGCKDTNNILNTNKMSDLMVPPAKLRIWNKLVIFVEIGKRE